MPSEHNGGSLPRPVAQLLVGLAVALWSASVGYGVSQSMLSRQVTVNTERVVQLEKVQAEIRNELVEIKRSQMEAMRATTALLGESHKMTTEVLKQSQIQTAVLERMTSK